MKTTLSLLLIAFSGFLLIQANPSFRGLQQNGTVVVLPTNATVVVNPSNDTSANSTNVTVNGSGNSTNVTVVNGTNSTNTTNSTTVPDPYAGYTQINVSDLNASWYNPAVYGAFRHGVNALVQTAIFQGRAPLAVYNVTQWISAYYRNVSSGVAYRFYVTLNNSRGVNVRMNLTVNYNRRRNVNLLGAYNYQVNNIPRGSFPSDGYRFATPSQLNRTTLLQGALRYGAEWMIQWLVDTNRIPAQDVAYTMNGLSLAVYRTQSNGTSYRFQTQNVNSNGTHVDTNYTVFYNSSDQSYNVTNYWYHGYGYNDSDLVNSTNLTNGTENVTVQSNSSTVLTGNETVTVVNNSTDVVGTGSEMVMNTTTANTTDTNATVPAVDVVPPVGPGPVVVVDPVLPDPLPLPVPGPRVTVDTSLVTYYRETETTTPLINYNRPALVDQVANATGAV